MSLSRFVPLTIAVAAAALAFSCASARAPRVSGEYSVHVTQVGDRAVADPDRLPVHARNGNGPDGKPRPSVVNWFAPTDRILMIEMENPAQECFRKEGPHNDGVFCAASTCHARTNVEFHGEKPAPCKYHVWFEGVTQPYDPIVIVDNCCP